MSRIKRAAADMQREIAYLRAGLTDVSSLAVSHLMKEELNDAANEVHRASSHFIQGHPDSLNECKKCGEQERAESEQNKSD